MATRSPARLDKTALVQAVAEHDLGDLVKVSAAADGQRASLNDWNLRYTLEWYHRSGSSVVNTRLRTGKREWLDELEASALRAIDQIDSLMRPITRDLLLFRGVRMPEALHEGQLIHERAFMSTSADRAMARSFTRRGRPGHEYLLELAVPAGTPFVPLDKYLADTPLHRIEGELVLGRGRIICIDSIDTDRKVPLVRARIAPDHAA